MYEAGSSGRCKLSGSAIFLRNTCSGAFVPVDMIRWFHSGFYSRAFNAIVSEMYFVNWKSYPENNQISSHMHLRRYQHWLISKIQSAISIWKPFALVCIYPYLDFFRGAPAWFQRFRGVMGKGLPRNRWTLPTPHIILCAPEPVLPPQRPRHCWYAVSSCQDHDSPTGHFESKAVNPTPPNIPEESQEVSEGTFCHTKLRSGMI